MSTIAFFCHKLYNQVNLQMEATMRPLFMKNIEAIREITKISQENFCGRDPESRWEDIKSIPGRDF